MAADTGAVGKVPDSTVVDSVVTEEETVKSLLFKRDNLFGRRQIILNYLDVDDSNIIEALSQAVSIHNVNADEINYLWNYYKGKHPVLHRTKEIRPEITNKVTVNIAYETVSFAVGYQTGEPILYVGRKADDEVTERINTLNDYMEAEDKASQDEEIVEWQSVCGDAYRMVLADNSGEEDESPFELYCQDPRNTGVAYSSGIGNKKLFGFVRYKVGDETEYAVYTERKVYYIRNSKIVRSEPWYWGIIPIFEYPANKARLGRFEIALSLMDALDALESNCMDGVEQTIQALWKFINCEIDGDGLKEAKELGAVMIKSVQGMNADVDVVKNDLNQDQVQTLKKDLYQLILNICGVPNRNGGSSTSDTGSAVIFRDGWESAEARAKSLEHAFKRSEKQMLKLVLKMCKELAKGQLKLSDISIKFTRRNYENIQSKAQVLTMMLASPKIHPKLAFEACGLFSDAEGAYTMSDEYYRKQMELWEPKEVDENEPKQPEIADGGGG